MEVVGKNRVREEIRPDNLNGSNRKKQDEGGNMKGQLKLGSLIGYINIYIVEPS